jgi:hypothetical protein
MKEKLEKRVTGLRRAANFGRSRLSGGSTGTVADILKLQTPLKRNLNPIHRPVRGTVSGPWERTKRNVIRISSRGQERHIALQCLIDESEIAGRIADTANRMRPSVPWLICILRSVLTWLRSAPGISRTVPSKDRVQSWNLCSGCTFAIRPATNSLACPAGRVYCPLNCRLNAWPPTVKPGAKFTL